MTVSLDIFTQVFFFMKSVPSPSRRFVLRACVFMKELMRIRIFYTQR